MILKLTFDYICIPTLFLKKDGDIVKTSIHPSIHPSVCPSANRSVCPPHYLLLNQWAEFYQTSYITCPYGKRVCKSNIIFPCICLCVSCPCICLSCYLLLNHWVECVQTCYITFPHGKGLFFCVSVIPSIHPFIIHPSVHHALS